MDKHCPYWDKNMLECVAFGDRSDQRLPCGSDSDWKHCHIIKRLKMEKKEKTKLRPDAEIRYSFGNDGRDAHDYVVYLCPVCKKELERYGQPDACDQCGTVFAWGERPPRIVCVKHLEWE